MSWSWVSPSPSEAEEAYNYYKGKYQQAAYQKHTSQMQEDAYISKKNDTIAKRDSFSTQKVNFEKRLRGVQEILKILQGTGGWFSADVPEAIKKAQNSLSKADTDFWDSIRVYGIIGSVTLEDAFKTKTVEEDAHSAAALAAFKSEEERLKREIENLQKQIDSLSDFAASLTRKIRECDATQRSLSRAMSGYAYDMNHYKKYMY